ncbi:MAG: ATP-dependent DNA helicase RecG [Bacteroidales bacterium]|nr:ATP-dependent DNA helicase RecG [Bacteroidales bacterium]
MADLNDDIRRAKGVGTRWAQLLSDDLDVHTYEDMLQQYPYKYVDRSHIYAVRDITCDMAYVQLHGSFISMNMVGEGSHRRLTAVFTDGTGAIEIVWFKGLEYVRNTIKTSEEYYLFGKPTVFGNRINIVHPELEKGDATISNAGTLQAVYNTSERMKKAGLNSKAVQKIILNIFAELQSKPIAETLPQYLIDRCHLMPRGEALRIMHTPPSLQVVENARYRLKFEELFYIQLKMLRTYSQKRMQQSGYLFATSGAYLNDFYKNHLPFEPTNAQKRVVHEIYNDLHSGKQMNRLLQGDVGSGKTMVALMAMLIAKGNGFQACMMAPTEILATQHYESLTKMLDGMPVRVELLTGSTKQRERRVILADLLSGAVDILVGTHALVEETVQFARLGLAVVDEQHRFGVAQRAKLWSKDAVPPHILVMTATPIPRTLAMTVYGDLDVSVIDELPPGRKAVMTEHYFHEKRNNLNRFIRAQLASGRQVYVVYPLIEESERSDFKNLTEGFEYMKSAFPEYKVCMVHGRLKPDEKDEAMRQFVENEAQIMVATTVIEVGVNVPNASVMVIESAERFGLSQLHQLRGRVGRGADQSYCILMTDYKLSTDTRRRMEIMVGTTNGFEIAEADMRLRGPGSIEGTQQSGLPFNLHVADLARDGQIVQYTRDIAQEIIKSDPTLSAPENVIMLQRLNYLEKNALNWSLIS